MTDKKKDLEANAAPSFYIQDANVLNEKYNSYNKIYDHIFIFVYKTEFKFHICEGTIGNIGTVFRNGISFNILV